MNSFMSHITKTLFRITMMRVGNKIKPEVAEEQHEGKSYNKCNQHSLTMIEPALEVQKEICAS